MKCLARLSRLSRSRPAHARVRGAPATSEGTGAAVFAVGAGSACYHPYRVTAGERIQIEVSGDGDTELDMYVYSPDGALIDEQSSYSDMESSYFTSYRSRIITVKIVNCGSVYNRYNLSVWGN